MTSEDIKIAWAIKIVAGQYKLDEIPDKYQEFVEDYLTLLDIDIDRIIPDFEYIQRKQHNLSAFKGEIKEVVDETFNKYRSSVDNK